MKVAALYDIHGNVLALEAALREVRDARVDLVVVGGDVLPGPVPHDTLACLMLRQFAESRGHSVLESALSWLARRPAVASVIAGATTSEQVLANARATAWQLTHADVAEVDAIVSRGPAARAKQDV